MNMNQEAREGERAEGELTTDYNLPPKWGEGKDQ